MSLLSTWEMLLWQDSLVAFFLSVFFSRIIFHSFYVKYKNQNNMNYTTYTELTMTLPDRTVQKWKIIFRYVVRWGIQGFWENEKTWILYQRMDEFDCNFSSKKSKSCTLNNYVDEFVSSLRLFFLYRIVGGYRTKYISLNVAAQL